MHHVIASSSSSMQPSIRTLRHMQLRGQFALEIEKHIAGQSHKLQLTVHKFNHFRMTSIPRPGACEPVPSGVYERVSGGSCPEAEALLPGG